MILGRSFKSPLRRRVTHIRKRLGGGVAYLHHRAFILEYPDDQVGMFVGAEQSQGAYQALPPARRRISVFLILEDGAVAVLGFGFRPCQDTRDRLDGLFVPDPSKRFGRVEPKPARTLPRGGEYPP